MVFETKRLIIRNLKTSDIDGFYDMQSNPKVMQYIKKHMNRTESEMELQRFIDYYANDTVFFNIWALQKKDTNEFIGICGIYKNDTSEFEIAYRLREIYWKKGYGTEVAKGLIRYCFEEEGLMEIAAYVSAENKGSVHILEKEMTYIKEFYSKKAQTYERLYRLKKEHWLQHKTVSGSN